MKNSLITFLLFASGIGIAYLIYQALSKKPAPVNTITNPGTAVKTPPTPYSDFLSLFGVPRSTGQTVDNTGQLITSAGGAFSGTVKAFSDLFKSTPIKSVTATPSQTSIYSNGATPSNAIDISFTDVPATP